MIAVVENGDDDDDDDSDDDVQVVIGDIKTSTTYSSLNIKRGGLLTSSGTAGNEKLKVYMLKYKYIIFIYMILKIYSLKRFSNLKWRKLL